MEQYNYNPEPQYQAYTPPPSEDQDNPSNGLATASLVLCICSIVFICCGGSVFFGALGVMLALLSRGSSAMSSNAKIGLGLSIGGFVVGFLVIIFAVLAFVVSEEGQSMYNQFQYDTEYNFDSPENAEDFWYDYFNGGDSYYDDGYSDDGTYDFEDEYPLDDSGNTL
jgi:hypothetical protein